MLCSYALRAVFTIGSPDTRDTKSMDAAASSDVIGGLFGALDGVDDVEVAVSAGVESTDEF